ERAAAAALPVAGCQGEAVIKLLAAEPFHRHARKQTRVVLAGVRARAGALVSLAQAKGPEEVAHVEPGGDELTRQLIEQFGMARGVFVVEVVHRVHYADAEEVPPEAVDGGAGEVGVVRRRDPFGQGDAGAGARLPGRLLAVEEDGPHGPLPVRGRQLPAV